MPDKDPVKVEEKDVEDEDVGRTCELRIRQQRYDRSGTQEDVVVESLKLPRGHGFDKAYAVVVNQVFDDKHRLEKEILTINSQHLLDAFAKIISSYPTVASDFSEPFEMTSPFQMLYHYWDDLDKYREEDDLDDVTRMHLNLLFDFMESTMGSEKKKCETQIKKGQIDFTRAWTIYRPGDLQIRHEHGHAWLLRCVKTAYEENTREGKYLEVHSTYTDFDGTSMGMAKMVTKLHQKRFFASEHPAIITDLPVYPRSFVDEDESLEEGLKERGTKFMSLNQTCVRQYDGPAAYMKQPPMDFYDPDMALYDTVWWPYKETGRVVIDRKTFQEDNELSQVGVSASPSDIDRMLCPPFVYGYSLAVKEWCRFYLTKIHEVQWKENSFDALVMQEDQKSLLRALVSSHSFPENPRDQTKQKGKGLVILLHGSPGSGKTLTAECSAEITSRALLNTSLAELNKENRAWYFEYRLIQVLQYATIWKAIVLFDEADVFLEARKDDVADAAERNALVAVFLRHLEYFSGIVFLTTNRVHVFDEAMKSRIHLALGYNPPEIEMRRMLWTKSLTSVSPDGISAELNAAIETFVKVRLNGREIANTINTAQTLARYEKTPLALKHIETVLGVRAEFDSGLRRMAVKSKASTSVGAPLVRRGSLLGAMFEEPEDM
ncbi:P-loop containing nucleoside triphosphate hydrolase protein [Amniculicola lignicola CBS 123094]|uniref:P-loop containing nucleoside triphosphate hydrolase protein n=1 Tax=Amniculicola lignicola CBS 123094 TaxID=1392246 RepID=A0A6A5WS80_9PLEO|nr:P-loop containing nucleoside triphosphate hydrolase protein [Amniculicola lignicola CBS 123094]